jgi:hypothetical protein
MEQRERLVSITLPHNHQSTVIPVASEALEALQRTGILQNTPLINVQIELESSRCSVEDCNEFGAYLFLPTCRRVCNTCLYKNAAFNIMTLPMAARLFSIPINDILNSEVPIIHAVGGSYQMNGLYNTTENKEALVSTAQVKEMCLKQRPLINMQRLHSNSIDNQDPLSYHLGRWILFDVPFRESLGKLSKDERSQDWYTAAACIPFPFVDEWGKVRKAFRCGGCDAAFWNCTQMKNLLGPKWEVLGKLFDIEDRLKGTMEGYDTIALEVEKTYLQEEFEEHIASCRCLKWLEELGAKIR